MSPMQNKLIEIRWIAPNFYRREKKYHNSPRVVVGIVVSSISNRHNINTEFLSQKTGKQYTKYWNMN